jgi:kynurenine formamidase
MKNKLVAASLVMTVVSLTWAMPKPSDLPEGMKPWWPSRYGRDDQLGTLNEINWITEIQSGTFQVGTQLDSIGHIQIGDRFYNGKTTVQVVEVWGLNRTVRPIVTRGVLVDVAAYKGWDRLYQGYVITLADMKGALAKQKIELRAGDAVLIHTGWGSSYGKDNAQFLKGEPGVGLEVVRWLYEFLFVLTHGKARGFTAAVVVPRQQFTKFLSAR